MNRRRIILAAAAFFAFAGVSGCGANDAEVGERDHAPANIINFPDHFSSVAHKCDGHGNRVYEADHGEGGGKQSSAIAVVRDPSCAGGQAEVTPEPTP